MALTDEEERVGWQSRNEIAYSPQIQSVHDCRTERLPGGECAGFNEWYVFDFPFDLRQLWHGNVFEVPMTPGQVAMPSVTLIPTSRGHSSPLSAVAADWQKGMNPVFPASRFQMDG
jgi:hypothetical protein